MTSLVLLIGLAITAAPQNSPLPEAEASAPADGPVRSALRETSIPWYDADRDEIRPLLPEPGSLSSRIEKRMQAFFEWLFNKLRRPPSSDESKPSLGRLLPTLVFLVCGILLALILFQLWRLQKPEDGDKKRRTVSVGAAARVAGLEAGESMEDLDPWAEANRRRAKGDLSGAVVWLFVDQLLSLDRLNLIRLTPGGTGRQYSHQLEDLTLREHYRAALGLFEQVYYGHQVPSPEAVAFLWRRAEAFRKRINELEASPVR